MSRFEVTVGHAALSLSEADSLEVSGYLGRHAFRDDYVHVRHASDA
jgi:hypothetical protein